MYSNGPPLSFRLAPPPPSFFCFLPSPFVLGDDGVGNNNGLPGYSPPGLFLCSFFPSPWRRLPQYHSPVFFISQVSEPRVPPPTVRESARRLGFFHFPFFFSGRAYQAGGTMVFQPPKESVLLFLLFCRDVQLAKTEGFFFLILGRSAP